uniref:IRG-type G domain-containing protein n=1 Tax=Seriola dumerili TaxID=41447 RepID=A0A3B4V7C6_SERDU
MEVAVLKPTGLPQQLAKIQEHMKQQNNIPLNIGITGEPLPTGCVENHLRCYTIPPSKNYPNVTLWDLPGIGNHQLSKVRLLHHISADRFRENDVKLAQEIQRMEKKFYFVRSKIDQDLRNEERSQREFNAEITLTQIRENCIQDKQRPCF